jgi:L-fuculose-phosphate aldolase
VNLFAARKAIVEIGRHLYAKGMVAGTDGNLSVRLGDRVLATPAGAAKGDLAPDDLVVVDLDGRPTSPRGRRPSSEIKMHLEAYRLRPEIGAVCHAHPPHATAYALAGRPLVQCHMPEIVLTLGAIPLARYATPSTDEVPAAIRALLPGADAILLEAHGVLALGRDPWEAYRRMETVEHYATIVARAETLGRPRVMTPDEVRRLLETRGGLGVEGRLFPCDACPHYVGAACTAPRS